MSADAEHIHVETATNGTAPVEPCTVVIFGGSGDLARRRLIPAIYNLLLDGLLPEHYAVLGLGRKHMTDEEFRRSLRLLADGRIPTDRLINRRATLSEGPELFDQLLASPETIKCMINF